MSESMQGRVALITGGSKGLGRAIALALAHEGAAVAVCARHGEALEEVAEEIRAAGGRVHAVQCDVVDGARVAALPDLVGAELGAVDILVNNAGIAPSHKFLGHPDDVWDRVMDVNLKGVFRVSRAFLPGMVERKWGRIINVASTAAKTGGAYIAAYSASKHGVLGLTRSLAVEFVKDNITVNAICPGYADTPMTAVNAAKIAGRTGRSEEEAVKFLANTSPQRRLIESEEVAHVAVMLAGEDAKGITGQAINVDGGMVMY